MRLTRHALVVAVLVLGLGARLPAQATVVPTDLQQPGTQPLQVSGLQSPDKCDNCHGGYAPAVEPARNWRGSMMAHATRDPLFWASVAIAEQDVTGAGDLCIRCHSPDGWTGGRSTPTDGTGLASGDTDGVSCDACHRMTNPDRSEHLGVQSAPFLAHDGQSPPTGYYGGGMLVLWADNNTKLGPFDDAQPNHGFLPSAFHRQAAFCGSCHDVSNPAVGDLAPGHGALAPLPGGYSGVPGAPVETKAAFRNFPFAYGIVERTFSEHQSSAFATLPVWQTPLLPPELQDGAIRHAYETALASTATGDYVDGAPRTFTCQTCHLPPVTGKGCNKSGVPTRSDLPLHDMTGGNVWMPDAIAWLDGQGRLFQGGGLTAAELAALGDGKLRAFDNLQRAAALAVEGDLLKVVNLTGHKLISGYPEGRRMWLHVTWYDEAQQVLREDGRYGPLAVVLDGHPLLVQTILEPSAPHTRVYEAHHGVGQEWAATLVGLGWPADLPLRYDRVTGQPGTTLGELAAAGPGTVVESFHFVLNDRVVADNRIPPYGFRRADATLRNCPPVPASQYGDPPVDGVYRHWDEVLLSPPAGARTAAIELLYQSTSWEYVQFLHLANDGSVAALADTGRDMLEAWLATGMAAPVVMATATWTGDGGGPPPTWVDADPRLTRDPAVDTSPRPAAPKKALPHAPAGGAGPILPPGS